VRQAGGEDDGFNRRASQLLDVSIQRNEGEADDDSNHQAADIFRHFWIGAHSKLFDVDPARANSDYGNCKEAIASITR
jgi:hypothetical protein